MDNFHFIDVKPTIDRRDAALLKDAIFKRAKEKAEELAAEKNENYTSQVQNDVMDVARESFQSSSLNPFNQFMENVGLQNKITEAIDKIDVQKETAPQQPEQTVDALDKIRPRSETVEPLPPANKDIDIEKYTENFTREVKRNIESVSNNAFVKSVQDETMASARNQFRTNLNVTLNFLNTQAAIRAAEDAHSKINYMI